MTTQRIDKTTCPPYGDGGFKPDEGSQRVTYKDGSPYD